MDFNSVYKVNRDMHKLCLHEHRNHCYAALYPHEKVVSFVHKKYIVLRFVLGSQIIMLRQKGPDTQFVITFLTSITLKWLPSYFGDYLLISVVSSTCIQDRKPLTPADVI